MTTRKKRETTYTIEDSCCIVTEDCDCTCTPEDIDECEEACCPYGLVLIILSVFLISGWLLNRLVPAMGKFALKVCEKRISEKCPPTNTTQIDSTSTSQE